ncbi:MAG: Spy/CpxP family protein refolding chaperone [bacterium]
MMRNRWLYVLLAASLAINLAAIGAFAYRRYRIYHKRQGVFRRLRMVAPQRMEPILNEYQFKMDSLRIEYWQARQELARLSFEEQPDTAAVGRKLQSIGEIHREMNRLVFETGRKTGMLMPPDFRERLRQDWCRMMEGPHPPPRPPGPGWRQKRRW